MPQSGVQTRITDNDVSKSFEPTVTNNFIMTFCSCNRVKWSITILNFKNVRKTAYACKFHHQVSNVYCSLGVVTKPIGFCVFGGLCWQKPGQLLDAPCNIVELNELR